MCELASAGHKVVTSLFNLIRQRSLAVYTFTMWTILVSGVVGFDPKV